MMIDKVGGIGPGNYGPKKTPGVEKAQSPVRGSDNVMISEEASRAADLARTSKLVKSSEDATRAEKMKEVKAKLANGDYDNLSDEVVGDIADKLTGAFLSEGL